MPYKDPDKHRQYQRLWQAKRRAEWIASHGPCQRCGSNEDLQVDHLDPALKVSHSVWSWSAARREAELRKCQVLCLSCHKAKTARELWRPISHGSESAYTARACRCEACREAHREARRAYAKRKKLG